MGHWLRNVGAALFTVVALLVIVVLVTGEVTLVTTHGQSMEPGFHSGDLAVIVPDSTYHVGEIVGYQSPLLHVTVLHRIVSERGGKFTFKGDNNSFLDPLRLPASTIKGRLWLHVPDGGTVLGWVRSPVFLGFLGFVFMALCVGGATRRRWGRGPSAVPGPSRSGPKHAAPTAVGAEWRRIAVPLALAGVLGVASVVTWSMPTTRSSERPLPYDQHIALSYSATAPVGAVYPAGSLSTGDPIFLRQVEALDVSIHYAFDATGAGSSDAREALTGTIGVTARVQGPAGWSGQLAVKAPEPFRGSTTSISFPVDLTRIAALEKAFIAATGMSLEGAQMAVVPTVHIDGTLAGAPVSSTFAPPIIFQMDGQALDVASTTPSGTSSGSSALEPNQSGSVNVPTGKPAQLSLLGRSVPVAVLRWTALIGVVLAILAAVVEWIWSRRRRRMDDSARIRAAHHHDLVPVASSPALGARLVVDVASFSALARLARRYDCVILELEHAGGHAYYVECGATIYRHGPDPAAGLSVVQSMGSTSSPGGTTVPDEPSDMTYYVRARFPAS